MRIDETGGGIARDRRRGAGGAPGPSASVFDPAAPSGVDSSATVPAATTSQAAENAKDELGSFLRGAREGREISLSEVAQKTKVPRWTLELLEKGKLDDLPAPVYVRGFIRSYARAVGVDEAEPLGLYQRAADACSVDEKVRSSTPVVAVEEEARPESRRLGVGVGPSDDEAMTPRRGLGLAVFVIILLLIATITLSLLLRRPPQSGDGLSLAPPAPASVSGTGPRAA